MAFKKKFDVNTEDVNSFGFWVLTSGIDLSVAFVNCPAFYIHDKTKIPLGHWENLSVVGNVLSGDLFIDGANDEERNYIRKIENGDIKGASIGADPIEWNNTQMYLKNNSPCLSRCVLFEISLTPLPSNTKAIALRHNGSFIELSAENVQNIIPLLKPEYNMKKIALSLGMAETATEDQINDTVKVLLAKANGVDALQAAVIKMGDNLPEAQKNFFVNLAKKDTSSALEFLNMQPTAAHETTTVKKDVKVSELVQLARQGNAVGGNVDDGKDTFDYLQKHNAVELARIRKDEPAKYTQLANEYGKGVRYTGK